MNRLHEWVFESNVYFGLYPVRDRNTSVHNLNQCYIIQKMVHVIFQVLDVYDILLKYDFIIVFKILIDVVQKLRDFCITMASMG